MLTYLENERPDLVLSSRASYLMLADRLELQRADYRAKLSATLDAYANAKRSGRRYNPRRIKRRVVLYLAMIKSLDETIQAIT